MNNAPISLNADDTSIAPVWSIMLKGASGSGKTILSCGKEFRPVYVFNCEGRFESVVNYYRNLDGHLKDVYYNNFTMSNYNEVKMKMNAILNRPEYKTVVMSSLTSFGRMVLNQLKGNLKIKAGIKVNILEDYNYEDAALFEMVAFLQDLKTQGVNGILEAHITPYEKKSKDEAGNTDYETVYEILTKGKKAPAEVPSWFNENWLLEKRTTDEWDSKSVASARYWVNTIGNKTSTCKTSFGIPSFDWTDTDPTIKLIEFLNPDIKKNPRVDPNAPKRVSW